MLLLPQAVALVAVIQSAVLHWALAPGGSITEMLHCLIINMVTVAITVAGAELVMTRTEAFFRDTRVTSSWLRARAFRTDAGAPLTWPNDPRCPGVERSPRYSHPSLNPPSTYVALTDGLIPEVHAIGPLEKRMLQIVLNKRATELIFDLSCIQDASNDIHGVKQDIQEIKNLIDLDRDTLRLAKHLRELLTAVLPEIYEHCSSQPHIPLPRLSDLSDEEEGVARAPTDTPPARPRPNILGNSPPLARRVLPRPRPRVTKV